MRTLLSLLAAVGLATFGAVLPAAPASADPLCVPVIPRPVCVDMPHGQYVCVYADGNKVCIEPI